MVQEIIVETAPKSSVSEAIKTIRTNIQFTSAEELVKTILVTSSIPGEGKSFISANLAVAYAKANKKVLLIDADMRRGRQHEIFKVSTRKGYSNLLINDVKKYMEYIQESKIENLSILTRGIIPPNPTELLQSKNNEKLFELLKNEYDIIIVDGVPVNGLTDSVILSPLADKAVIVCALNETPLAKLQYTKKTLENVDCDIAGIIVNKVADKRKYHNEYYY